MPEVLVTAPRLDLLGTASTASQGIVDDEEIQETPAYRPGQILETVPGLTVTLRSGEGRANCAFVVANAMAVAEVVPEPVDYVFLANTFHGVPDQLGLACAVAALLEPKGQFGIVDWHRRLREETVVLGQPRGPKTEMRMEADDVAAIVEPAGLLLKRTVELPPYHYGVIFQRGRNE